MASYRQGTVTVTRGSKIITGVDTAFNTVGIYAGDIFSLVDGNNIPTGSLYEVASVESDTKLTLLQAYQGTSGSAKNYVIMNMAGNQTTPRFAAKVSKLLSEVQPISDAISDESVPAGIPQAGSDGKLDDGWLPMLAGATSSQAGAAGLVPAPTAGKQGSYLMGNGTWGRDADVLAAVAAGQIGGAATVNEVADLDEYQTQGTYYFVWHSGNEHFPVEVGGYLIVVTGKGSSLVRQLYLSNHAAKAEIYTRLYNAGTWGDWCKIINHKDTMTGASQSQAGTAGLVPAPTAGKQGSYLMGNGTWGRDADVLAAVAAGQIGHAANVVGESLDVDTLTTAGKYYLNGTGTYLNLPSGVTLGYLTVHSVTTGGPVQQILTTHTRRVYIRAKTSGTAAWTDWVNIAPPYAQTGEGIGQWVKIDIQDGSAYSLPDGGRWEYFLQLFNKTDGGLYSFASGVSAGGTSLTSGNEAYRYVGFAKRVE